MSEGDRKTVNGITVEIHKITETEVYYAQYLESEWGKGWPFYRMPRAEFERYWETDK